MWTHGMNVAAALSNPALVVITVVYVWFTYRMLKHSQEQSFALARPYVVVDAYAHPGEDIFRLRIRNLGATAAINLRLSLDRSFYKLGQEDPEHDISKYPAFTKPMPAFAPKGELIFFLGQVFAYKCERTMPTNFNVTAVFEYGGETITETTVVDLNIYSKSALNTDPTIYELREMRKALEDIRDNVKRPDLSRVLPTR